MNCPNCGTENPDQTTFCMACGTRLSPADEALGHRSVNEATQVMAYRDSIRKRNLGIVGVCWSGLFFFVVVAAVLAPDSNPFWPVAGPLLAIHILILYLSIKAIIKSKKVLAELQEQTSPQQNIYWCPCGSPKKRFFWLHYLLSIVLFPWGLISLFFPLKKCRSCGTPYTMARRVMVTEESVRAKSEDSWAVLAVKLELVRRLVDQGDQQNWTRLDEVLDDIGKTMGTRFDSKKMDALIRGPLGAIVSRLGPSCLPQLIKGFSSTNEFVRYTSVELVAQFKMDAIPHLLRTLESSSTEMKTNAAWALERMGPPDSIVAKTALEQVLSDAIEAGVVDSSRSLIMAILAALAGAGTTARFAIPTIFRTWETAAGNLGIEAAAENAMQAVSGQNFGHRPQDWRTWVEAQFPEQGGRGTEGNESMQVSVEKKGGDQFVDLPNHWGLGNGSAFRVMGVPDLQQIFRNPELNLPFVPSGRSREYWSQSNHEAKLGDLAAAYLQHPDAKVRRATIELVTQMDISGVVQPLIDRLADDDLYVRKAAAKEIWRRQLDTNCQLTVAALRDEVQGHHTGGGLGPTAQGLTLGREKAIQALDLLVEEAPDQNARTAIGDLIQRDVIIEERIESAPAGSVSFVETVRKDQFTYEVYRAINKQEALTFLKSKQVSKELYYIEVETPDGTFGRDIHGMYEV